MFALPLSFNGAQAATVALQDIHSGGFTVSIAESSDLDQVHNSEDISYIAMETGTWLFGDDKGMIDVGTVITDNVAKSPLYGNFQWVSFQPSAEGPYKRVIFTQVQDAEGVVATGGSKYVHTRQDRTGTDGSFYVALEDDSAALGAETYGTAKVGWMALRPGTGTWSGLAYEAKRAEDLVDYEWKAVEFETAFSGPPVFVASNASYKGDDAVVLRYKWLNRNRVQLMVQEDVSGGNNPQHTTERIDYLAISGVGDLLGRKCTKDPEAPIGQTSGCPDE